jgi:hypothetical protein
MGNLIRSENGKTSDHWAKATRTFNRAQVQALQVIQALEPAPNKPEALGL